MSEVSVFKEISDWLIAQFPNVLVDLDFGQLEALQQNQPLPQESIFVEFSDTQWSTQAGNQQQGNALISFRCAFEMIDDSYTGSASRENAVEKMRRITDYHSKLQGLYGAQFSPLDRVRSYIERRDDGMRVQVLQYRTQILEDSANNIGVGGSVTVIPVPVYNPELIP